MNCKCGAVFHTVHPRVNRCSCGAVYDGSGKLIDGKPQDKAERTPRSYSKSPERVGTALESLIPDWAVADRRGCDCKSWVRKMDSWGVVGCEANRQAIITRLVKQRDRLIPLLRGIPEPLARIGASKLLDKAIKKAQSS